LAVICTTYLLLGSAYAALTPTWQAPDEPAHYNYVKYIATEKALPVLQPGDWNAAELEELKAAGFPPGRSVAGIRYEFWQPPLYYLLLAPLYTLTTDLPLATQVIVLRLASLILSLGTLLLTYAIVRTALPGRPGLALAATGLTAAIPMHLAMNAAINNDTLANLLLAALTLLALRWLEGTATPRQLILWTALLFGLGLITKATVYPAALLLLAAGPGRTIHHQPSSQSPIPQSLISNLHAPLTGLALSLLIGGWFFVRNALVYGNLDILGRLRHDAVVTGQPRTTPGLDAAYHLITVSLQSFWGQFGWMGVLLDNRIYIALTILVDIALVGLALTLWRHRRHWLTLISGPLGLLGLNLLLVTGLFLQYNLVFIQAQGRYLFPALPTLALLLVIGWQAVIARPPLLAILVALGGGWAVLNDAGRLFLVIALGLAVGIALLQRLCPRLAGAILAVTLYLALVGLDLYSLYGAILPALTHP